MTIPFVLFTDEIHVVNCPKVGPQAEPMDMDTLLALVRPHAVGPIQDPHASLGCCGSSPLGWLRWNHPDLYEAGRRDG